MSRAAIGPPELAHHRLKVNHTNLIACRCVGNRVTNCGSRMQDLESTFECRPNGHLSAARPICAVRWVEDDHLQEGEDVYDRGAEW